MARQKVDIVKRHIDRDKCPGILLVFTAAGSCDNRILERNERCAVSRDRERLLDYHCCEVYDNSAACDLFRVTIMQVEKAAAK